MNQVNRLNYIFKIGVSVERTGTPHDTKKTSGVRGEKSRGKEIT